jgi:hypothetical protein
MIKLSEKWIEYLKTQPETGMSFQVATVELKDGRVFERVLIVDDAIQEIDHAEEIPFSEMDEIVSIRVQSGLGNGSRY